MVRLRRVSSQSPGWTRLHHGKGFRYLDCDGEPLSAEDKERVKDLVIPPAWREVWICPQPNGHLQAVGTDDAGRRQYLYHPVWRERRDAEKYDHMQLFARSLIKNRSAARRDITDEPTLTSVTAMTFGLLDLGMFRIGSDRYTDENGSYGLTTIERSHVVPDGRATTFTYVAKSGQDLDVTVRDERIGALVQLLAERDGGSERLLAYRDGNGWHDLDADHVNTYVKQTLGDEFSAKDFRTWRGTVIAADELSVADGSTKTSRKKAVAATMRTVGEHLGNTPSIAKASYVDPRVVDLFQDGVTVAATRRRSRPGAPVNRRMEKQVLSLLKKA